jgi:hypothetical protein
MTFYFAYGSNMAAACAWKLPARYVRSMERWSVWRGTGAGAVNAGEEA